jgi:hypothetical protein
MLFRSIALIVLIAFINLIFIDCSGRITIKKTPAEVAAVEKITKAILPSGEVISFDKAGATFAEYKKERIVGKTPDGKILSLPAENISEVRGSSPKFYRRLEDLRGKRISELFGKERKLIRFYADGAYYDDADSLIKGTTIEGKQFSEKIQSILGARVASPEVILKDELVSKKDRSIAEVITDSGKIILFNTFGGKFYKAHSALSGSTKEGKYVEVDADEILYVTVEKYYPSRAIVGTIGALLLFVGFVFLLALATKESCPFVYSYDGQQYVFDAEPLGGAICAGLTKTDFSRLENSKPVNGEYQLMFRNEVPEIQYLDQVKLVYIDHKPGAKVVPDLEGNFYSVKKPQLPSSSVNEDGLDLTNFIKQSDGIFWQTKLPSDKIENNGSSRHQLTFKFSKPRETKQAQLIVNAGTALWGSNMIRKMLQLRGNKVDEWYTKINNQGPELRELYQFMEREELYSLKINVRNGNEWVQKGIIPGGGPFITEDRIISIDLSDIEGDQLEIQLDPPKGFWALDYIAISYDAPDTLKTNEITPSKVMDSDGVNETESLLREDQAYYEMVKVGDWAKFHFVAPPVKNNLERTIFLKTTGYYEIQIDKTKPERTQLIRELIETPGLIVDYSLTEFLKWRTQMASAK